MHFIDVVDSADAAVVTDCSDWIGFDDFVDFYQWFNQQMKFSILVFFKLFENPVYLLLKQLAYRLHEVIEALLIFSLSALVKTILGLSSIIF